MRVYKASSCGRFSDRSISSTVCTCPAPRSPYLTRAESLGQNEVYYLFSDHLGSLNLTVDPNGALRAVSPGSLETELTFTGQREQAEVGLFYYQSRWYDGQLGRFVQADTLLPEPGSPLAWDRYSYTFNNPIRYNDPSGHCPLCLVVVGALFIGAALSVDQINQGVEQMQWASQQPAFAQEQAAVQQWQDNCMGQCHYSNTAGTDPGAALGGPIPATPITDIYSEGLANATQGAIGLVGSATGVYQAGGAMVSSLGTARLQAITNAANQQLGANPALAQTVLSGSEYAAGQSSTGIARMQYGNAVERLVAQRIRSSPVDSLFYRHVGGPSNPDFAGRGILSGMNFDITTPLQVGPHLLRPYGPGLNIITYSRPNGFYGFPQ